MKRYDFVELIPAVKKYEWGKKESTALTKTFFKNINSSVGDEEEFLNDTYAELWYGSHISSPSKVVLKNQILENTTIDDIISSESISRFDRKLPFILKILSISKPLSLQVHPDEYLAKELHSKHPDKYPDDKHKPEIAIALTEFEAFCGFQKTSEIISNIKRYPELRALLVYKDKTLISEMNQENTRINDQDQDCDIKKEIFINILNADSNIVEKSLIQLIDRIKNMNNQEKTITERLIIRLNEHFPLNIGIICPIFLNYIKLEPGDAIFIGAGTIHSYLSGECIECMANSDNVIRCGLTSKFKDVPNLIRAVDFRHDNFKFIPSDESILKDKCYDFTLKNKVNSLVINDYLINNITEFRVQILNFDMKTDPSIEIETCSYSPSLFLCLNGSSNFAIGNEKGVLFQGKSIFVNSSRIIKLNFNDLNEKYIKLVLVTIPTHLERNKTLKNHLDI